MGKTRSNHFTRGQIDQFWNRITEISPNTKLTIAISATRIDGSISFQN